MSLHVLLLFSSPARCDEYVGRQPGDAPVDERRLDDPSAPGSAVAESAESGDEELAETDSGELRRGEYELADDDHLPE